MIAASYEALSKMEQETAVAAQEDAASLPDGEKRSKELDYAHKLYSHAVEYHNYAEQVKHQGKMSIYHGKHAAQQIAKAYHDVIAEESGEELAKIA